ncbi:MAG TPA: DapH/DapD/GlmU-related protein [Caproiciproducens sp.]|nr:DapH/DapD/GlmU-related protein [Caproiciproducens sp.]
MKQIFGKILYRTLAKHLPASYSGGLGSFGRILRGFSARLMLRHCGRDVNIESGAAVDCKVSIGNRSGVGVRSTIDGAVQIGDDVMMGPEVYMTTYKHCIDRTDIPMNRQGVCPECPIIIGDDVWIGARTVILPGVTVERGAVIAAGAVVTRNVPAFSVVAGVPARVIKYRGQEE